MGRQVWKKLTNRIPTQTHIRRWAYENAYMLAFVLFFLIVTWIYLTYDKVTR